MRWNASGRLVDAVSFGTSQIRTSGKVKKTCTHRFYSLFPREVAIICMNKPFNTFPEPNPLGRVFGYGSEFVGHTKMEWRQIRAGIKRLGSGANSYLSVSIWCNDHF